MAEIVATAGRAGIVEFGVTDHSGTIANDESLRAARAEFDSVEKPKGFHFGLEVAGLRQYDVRRNAEEWAKGRSHGVLADEGPEGELAIHLTGDLLEELGVEYTLGEAHWPLGCELTPDAVVRSYHRQYLFLAQHPLVSAVAHPWCLMGPWKKKDGSRTPNFQLTDFDPVPKSMHDEFAASLVEHSTLMELPGGLLLPPHKFYTTRFMELYRDYLVEMKERGVKFCFGSDSHGPGYRPRQEESEAVLTSLGFSEGDFASPLDRW